MCADRQINPRFFAAWKNFLIWKYLNWKNWKNWKILELVKIHMNVRQIQEKDK